MSSWLGAPASERSVPSAATPDNVATAIGRLRDVLWPAEGRVELAIRGGNRVPLGNQIVFDVKSKVSGHLIVIDINAAGK